MPHNIISCLGETPAVVEQYLINAWSVKAFKGTVVNRAFPSLHRELLEITLTVPLWGKWHIADPLLKRNYFFLFALKFLIFKPFLFSNISRVVIKTSSILQVPREEGGILNPQLSVRYKHNSISVIQPEKTNQPGERNQPSEPSLTSVKNPRNVQNS